MATTNTNPSNFNFRFSCALTARHGELEAQLATTTCAAERRVITRKMREVNETLQLVGFGS